MFLIVSHICLPQRGDYKNTAKLLKLPETAVNSRVLRFPAICIYATSSSTISNLLAMMSVPIRSILSAPTYLVYLMRPNK